VAVALAQALLLQGAVPEHALREALYVSVARGVPFASALIETGAVSREALDAHLARSPAPALQRVAPLPDLVERLPPGLCARLLAVPVRRDAITGTVDVAVPDPLEPHGAHEIGFHLDAPVRPVRASTAAIEDALYRLRRPSRPPVRMTLPPAAGSAMPPPARPRDDVEYDSRPTLLDESERAGSMPPPSRGLTLATSSLPPPPAVPRDVRPSYPPQRLSAPPRGGTLPPPRGPMKTPPWGTPVHLPKTEPPLSGFGSEIPIPLTRRAPIAGGTQRPPPMMNPSDAGMGHGYPVDPDSVRTVVEVDRSQPPAGPAPLPAEGRFAAFAPQLPFADATAVLEAIRAGSDRDAVLELVLTATRLVAGRVAIFVVKQSNLVGWLCTPELGDLRALKATALPIDSPTALSQAIHEGSYLGPLRHDASHAPLLSVMKSASRDVAVLPIRVTGRTVAIVLADELGDTMLSTRRIEEIVHAAGEAFTRIVRHRK
jgi:hypothetical protein